MTVYLSFIVMSIHTALLILKHMVKHLGFHILWDKTDCLIYFSWNVHVYIVSFTTDINWRARRLERKSFDILVFLSWKLKGTEFSSTNKATVDFEEIYKAGNEIFVFPLFQCVSLSDVSSTGGLWSSIALSSSSILGKRISFNYCKQC